MAFKNTPKTKGSPPRVKTKARGGDIAPDYTSPDGPTTGPRGKYPKSNGGPPESHSEWMSSRETGDHMEADVPALNRKPPTATRKTPRERTTTNPLK